MEYPQNVWYCSALSTEISNTPLARMICDKPIVFYRGESGKVVALEDRCAHRQAPLSLGRVQGDDIECGYHGFVFDCAGACVHVPHQDTVPNSARIAAYPAVERWGYVWLWLDDPAARCAWVRGPQMWQWCPMASMRARSSPIRAPARWCDPSWGVCPTRR